MDAAGLADRFHYVGELDRAAKIAFLQSLDLFCLPTVYRESKGLSVLEAWANAVPAVLPAHGALPEMVEDTGGGLLCEPNDPAALAAGLKRMILEPDFAAECGRRAQQAVHERYNAEVMARRMIELYEGLGLGIRDWRRAVSSSSPVAAACGFANSLSNTLPSSIRPAASRWRCSATCRWS